MTVSPSAEVSRSELIETRRIQLTSPLLHIGGAISQLSPFEYIKTKDRVYLPNLDALMSGIQQVGRLDDYVELVKKRKPIADFLISVFGEDWRQATGKDGEQIFPGHMTSQLWANREAVGELRSMIRDGFGRLYVPGTSIKGAIRTAIAYHFLKHAEQYRVPKTQQVSAIEGRLKQSMGNLKRGARFADDLQFMNQLFTAFALRYSTEDYQGPRVEPRPGPNSDFMRALQVTDSSPILGSPIEGSGGELWLDNQAIVPEVIVSSYLPGGQAKYRSSIYPEMVHQLKVDFGIRLDCEMLSWFENKGGMRIPFNSIEDLFRICAEFAQDQWDTERLYWQGIQRNPDAEGRDLDFGEIRSFYETPVCPYSLRLGWGTGLPGTTVTMLFNDDLRSEIRDTCGIRAPGFGAPKSRRTVVGQAGVIQFVPGWVTFEERV
jgi:CRISPR-associated protein Csm5